MKRKILVGLSGGVDSALAAALLLAEGHEVHAVTMKIWDGEAAAGETRSACYGADEGEDLAQAAAVAAQLGIRHTVIDLAAEYRATVLAYFAAEYRAGRTPNPCMRCNQAMKFGALLDGARRAGIAFDAFATGHYARVTHNAASGRYELRRGDSAKDQSYFLALLTQEQLARVRFPLGEMAKAEVRRRARELGLPVHDRAESQDFYAGDIRDLMDDQREGPILDAAGQPIGTHQGIGGYTIGQRKGINISAPQPLYVTAIDTERNAVCVGPESDLYAVAMIVQGINWVSREPGPEPFDALAQIRYRHNGIYARVTPLPDAGARVLFAQAQRAVTPGQFAVFYDGDAVVGGGVIAAAVNT